MIEKLNNIWRNLFVAFFLILLLTIFVSYNFLNYEKENQFSISDKIAFVIYILLLIHFLIITFLIIKNLIFKKYLKSLAFFLMNIVLAVSIYIFFLFIGAFSLGLGTYTDDYQIHNFRKSKTCSEINKQKLQINIENLSKKVYSKEFNKEFIKDLKNSTKDLPKKIIKIECGCRETDTTIIVFRILDIDKETYELELERENNKWKYKSLSPAIFEN